MKATLDGWTKEFSQVGDCVSGEETQLLTLRQVDGGGGPFWIVTTELWAFNSIAEVVEMLRSAGVAETEEPLVEAAE